MFKVGDIVKFLNEEGEGKVVALQGDFVIVEDEFGFENKYPYKELVPDARYEDYQLGSAATDQYIKEEIKANSYAKIDASIAKSTNHLDEYAQQGRTWQIDLHIEQLIDSHRGMNNSEILLIQVNRLRHFIYEAIERKVRRLIIIHGKGEGVLRHEVRDTLNGYENMEYFDASYQEFGGGATEVIVRYNY